MTDSMVTCIVQDKPSATPQTEHTGSSRLCMQAQGLAAGWSALNAALAVGSGVGMQLLRMYDRKHQPLLPNV